MQHILKKYDEDKLQRHYINKSLGQLEGIGKKREQCINDYFKKKLEPEEPIEHIEIIEPIEIIEIIQKEFQGYITDAQIDTIKNNLKKPNLPNIIDIFEQIKNLNSSKNIKCQLFLYLTISPIKSEYIKNIYITLRDIINDPMNLKDIDSKRFTFSIIDTLALNNNWWNISDEYRLLNKFEDEIVKALNKNGNVYLLKHNICYIYNNVFENNVNNNSCDFLDEYFTKLNINNEEVYAYKKYYRKEKNIYNIIKTNIKTYNLDKDIIIDSLKSINNNLTEEQLNTIYKSLNNNISIVQGSPGTGKTSNVIKSIIEYVDKTNVLAATPTHASKKKLLKDLNTNIDCFTIQSLTYKYYDNDIEEYTCKLWKEASSIKDKLYIIVDEAGMIDLDIFNKLIEMFNITKKIHLILVGDIRQLPAIGTGQVFKDLFNSKIIPSSNLTKNFRAQNSDIPIFLNDSFEKDNYFLLFDRKYKNIRYKDGDIISNLEKILHKLKNNGYNLFDGSESNKTIGIVTPSIKSKIFKTYYGIIRKIFFNNDSIEEFSEKDSIMFTNNTSIFCNGDYGRIIKKYNEFTYDVKVLDPNGELDTVKDIDIQIIDKEKNIYRLNKRNFMLSYILTVHKSQGLGFDKLIYIAYEQKIESFVTKNLNYTAVSRGKEDVYLLGKLHMFTNSIKSNKITTLNKLFENKIEEISEENYDIEEDLLSTDYKINNTDFIKRKEVKKRKKIPKAIRHNVWEIYNGHSLDGKCYVCDEQLLFRYFQIGHIQSLAEGGNDLIDNLAPICSSCNLGMGTNNLEDYKKKYYKNK